MFQARNEIPNKHLVIHELSLEVRKRLTGVGNIRIQSRSVYSTDSPYKDKFGSAYSDRQFSDSLLIMTCGGFVSLPSPLSFNSLIFDTHRLWYTSLSHIFLIPSSGAYLFFSRPPHSFQHQENNFADEVTHSSPFLPNLRPLPLISPLCRRIKIHLQIHPLHPRPENVVVLFVGTVLLFQESICNADITLINHAGKRTFTKGNELRNHQTALVHILSLAGPGLAFSASASFTFR